MRKLDNNRMQELRELQEKIGYEFKDIDLLENALTHSSYVLANGKDNENIKNNERLEFLGDAVLELSVSEYIFVHYPDMNEGLMTRARAAAVCEDSLFEAACLFNLGNYLNLSVGEDRSNGRAKASILSDAFEALIAAVYLDGGFEAAKKMISALIPKITSQSEAPDKTDPKTKLQEYLQRDGSVSIRYVIIGEEGPAHEKKFTAAVYVDGEMMGQGQGKNKKEAEQSAASQSLGKLDIE